LEKKKFHGVSSHVYEFQEKKGYPEEILPEEYLGKPWWNRWNKW